jgi:NAD(P)-dependent dehydrogenase (short-subunit alcohol dehydrogenase family)
MAIEFARRGADVFLSDINEIGLDETCEQVRSLGRQCHGAFADISKKEEVKAMVDKAISDMGAVDILVNNAGVTVIGEIKDVTIEDWDWIIGINLWGPIYGVQYMLPHMLERKKGHIVNMASMGGLMGIPSNGLYSVTKFGIVGFSETLRAELRKHNIGVTLICPSFLSSGKDFEARGRVRGLPKFKPGGFAKGAVMPVEQAARKFVDAIKKDRFLVTTGHMASFMYRVKTTLPWLYRRMTDRMAADLEKLR